MRVVTVRLATTTSSEVREAFRDGTSKAIIAITENTTERVAARSGFTRILVAVHIALASQSRSRQHGSNCKDKNRGDLHFGKFEVDKGNGCGGTNVLNELLVLRERQLINVDREVYSESRRCRGFI